MPFAINPSLNHIDIPVQYITEIYRSKGEVQLPDARFKGHSCEAYICISRVEKTLRAYVALLEMGVKSILVYTSDYSADNSDEYPKVLAEAVEFVQSMGFSMERVNLDFSVAMREVIIKGISVMRPPHKKPVLRSAIGKTVPEKPLSVPVPAAVPEIVAVSIIQGGSDSTVLNALQAELLSLRTAVKKVTSEKLAFEISAAREIAALKASLEKAAELKRLGDEKLANEIDSVKREAYAAAIRKQEELAAALKGKLDACLRDAELAEKSHETQISALQENIHNIKSHNSQLANQLSVEKTSSAEKISQLIAEKDSICATLTAEKTAADDKIAALALFEASWREGQQREEDLCRNLDLLNEQICQLKKELDASQKTAENENVLTLKIVALEKELAAAKTEIERIVSSTVDRDTVQTELKGYAEAQKDVEAEYIRMATEKIEKEAELLDALYAADAEIVRLSREIEARNQVAEMEKTALMAELRQLLLSGAPIASMAVPDKPLERREAVTVSTDTVKISAKELPPPELEASPAPRLAAPVTETIKPSVPSVLPEVDIIEMDDDIADTPVSGEPEITKGLLNEFGSFCGSSSHSTTEFSIDPDMSTIEYSDPAEIVAILSSSNSVQAVLAGNRIQKCRGYIIATKSGGVYRTFVAWHLTESKQLVICTPEQHPADSAECTKVLQDAIAYFEIVGFMMELEDLGGSLKSYTSVIQKIPVLSRK